MQQDARYDITGEPDMCRANIVCLGYATGVGVGVDRRLDARE